MPAIMFLTNVMNKQTEKLLIMFLTNVMNKQTENNKTDKLLLKSFLFENP